MLRERLDRGCRGGRDRRRLDRLRGRGLGPAARAARSRSSSPPRSRSSACWAPRSARSTATSTPTTACGCCSAPASRRSRAPARSSASARATAARSTATSSSSASACSRARRSPPAPASPSSDGILVDEHLQTSVPGVFAAGDVANAHHPFYGERVRVEHWANALHQGPVAARGMLGGDDVYDRLPYFFSDQYDVGMEYAGCARSWDRVVFRGDPARARVHRLLAARGSRRGRDERQRLGRQPTRSSG